MIIAVSGAAYGVLISVLATSAATPNAGEGQWNAIGMIILGSGLVQLIAQLAGTGWGLLLGSSPLAIAADVVVLLGLWILTGAVPRLQGIQGWLALRLSAEPAVWPDGRPSGGLMWASSCLCGWSRSTLPGYSVCTA